MIARLDGTAALVTGASAPRQLGRAGERGTGFPHLAATPRDRYLRLDDDQDHRICAATRRSWAVRVGTRAAARLAEGAVVMCAFERIVGDDGRLCTEHETKARPSTPPSRREQIAGRPGDRRGPPGPAAPPRPWRSPEGRLGRVHRA